MERLRRRSDFLKAATGARANTPAFALQALARGWRSTVGLSNEQMAAQVAADRIDVLYEGRVAGSFPPDPELVNEIGLRMTGGAAAA